MYLRKSSLRSISGSFFSTKNYNVMHLMLKYSTFVYNLNSDVILVDFVHYLVIHNNQTYVLSVASPTDIRPFAGFGSEQECNLARIPHYKTVHH